MTSAPKSTESSTLFDGRAVAVIARRPSHDPYRVTLRYSKMLADGIRRRGIPVRSIPLPEPAGQRAFLDAVLDPGVAAIFLRAPVVELDELFASGTIEPTLAHALAAKRFVIEIGNPAFRPSSSTVTALPLRNARFVYIDRDSLEYMADRAGRRDHLAFHSLPSIVKPFRPSALSRRQRTFVFAATVRDPSHFRALWRHEQPVHRALFDDLVESVQPFDVSIWRTASAMMATRDLPFGIHDPAGVRLLMLANDFVYHRGKRRLLERTRRFAVTYVIDGGPPPDRLASGSESLDPMAFDALIGLVRTARAAVSYPPNRMIGAVGSRVPNALAVGALPVTGVTPAIAENVEVAASILGFDHRFDGLENAMERIATHPADFETMAALGPAVARRHFDPETFIDAMLALARQAGGDAALQGTGE